MEFTIAQIAQLLDGEVKGNGEEKVTMLAKIQDARKGQIAFLSNLRYEPHLYTTEASAVIVNKDFVPRKPVTTTLIRVENAYVSFTALLEEYHKLVSFQKTGVEEPAYVGRNVVIGDDVYRGAFSYIGNNVVIGRNVKIYPHVYIGDDVTIGDNNILHPNVKVYAGAKIGSHCVIHAGAVIGKDGFGFAPQQDGSYKAIPQLGNVVIHDHVSIGANTVIDCATLAGDATVIGAGVKLDNLIQIAHNVEIGPHTVIAAQTGISGSTRIGAHCVIGGQVGTAGHLTIANRTSIGAQAGILKSIQDEGEQLLGAPAFDVKEYFRAYAVFKKLPDLHHRLQELQQRISALEGLGTPTGGKTA